MILITRPVKEAFSTQQILDNYGFTSFVEPMLYLRLGQDSLPKDLHSYTVLITSSNALCGLGRIEIKEDVKIVVVGEKLHQNALEMKFEKAIYGGHTVECMVKYVKQNVDKSRVLLYLRGRHISFNLSQCLREEGYVVRETVVYSMAARGVMTNSLCNKISCGEIKAVLLYSLRAANIFAKLINKYDLYDRVEGCIGFYVLSDSIAQALPFSDIYVAHSPNQESLVDILRLHFKGNDIKT